MFINDDWKVNKNLTINMGLRYEYETAYTDPEDRLTRPLDLTSPIPEMQGANAPQMPAELSAVLQGADDIQWRIPVRRFLQPRPVERGKGGFSPRIGMAYRINDLTSFRVGYGRYLTPWTGGTFNIFDTYYVGLQERHRRLSRGARRSVGAAERSVPGVAAGGSGIREEPGAVHIAGRFAFTTWRGTGRAATATASTSRCSASFR